MQIPLALKRRILPCSWTYAIEYHQPSTLESYEQHENDPSRESEEIGNGQIFTCSRVRSEPQGAYRFNPMCLLPALALTRSRTCLLFSLILPAHPSDFAPSAEMPPDRLAERRDLSGAS